MHLSALLSLTVFSLSVLVAAAPPVGPKSNVNGFFRIHSEMNDCDDGWLCEDEECGDHCSCYFTKIVRPSSLGLLLTNHSKCTGITQLASGKTATRVVHWKKRTP
ncbi:hypothetical protein FB451DRAFT_1179428 [Mycena latifolia]|nr:hypothetical protein FB451DRAFT_1179428 [Mycena latifolia]